MTVGTVAHLLADWLDRQPRPCGEVLTGDAGFRLCRNPDTSVGIDIAYVSAALAAATPEDAWLIDGAPTLAVEILSPANTREEITERVTHYLESRVALTWMIDPVFRTVHIFRPDALPARVNETQELSGEPHLPGFRVAVADLFAE